MEENKPEKSKEEILLLNILDEIKKGNKNLRNFSVMVTIFLLFFWAKAMGFI